MGDYPGNRNITSTHRAAHHNVYPVIPLILSIGNPDDGYGFPAVTFRMIFKSIHRVISRIISRCIVHWDLLKK